MITEAQHYGGAARTTVSTTLHAASSRVLCCHNSSGITVTLADLSAWEAGRRFFVLALAAGGVTVNGVTLTTNQCRRLRWTGSAWVGRTIAVNATGAGGKGSFSTTEAAGVQTYNEVCSGCECTAVTDECCKEAKDAGNEPLDGEDGRDLCVVPLYEDVVANALNYAREPIRARDFVMPKIIPVCLPRERFEADPLHPLASVVLSEEAWAALDNDGRAHNLEYAGTADGETRHWHHVRWGGADPSPGFFLGDGASAFEVRRHVWEREVLYTPAGTSTEYSLIVRLVAEHTASAEPQLQAALGDGTCDEDYGAWGTIFNLYVLCEELFPGFADLDDFQPVEAGDTVVFTLNDPCAWGGAYGISVPDTSHKYMHPWMLAAASFVMTWNAPMQYEWVPVLEREYLDTAQTIRGLNRVHCYRWSNGAPWTPGTCADDTPNGAGIIGNIVFGLQEPGAAGMTLGGGFDDDSAPNEWLCWENGLGLGRTYLKPLMPGWDEECGSLQVSLGNSGTVKLCTNDDCNHGAPDDGSGRCVWPVVTREDDDSDVDGCRGHPAQPFEGVGGSHGCFNSNGPGTTASKRCCVATSPAALIVKDRCVKETSKTDAECNPTGSDCETIALRSRTYRLPVEDYTFMMGGSQDIRTATWVGEVVDPDWVPRHYAYDDTSVENQTPVGTWTLDPANIELKVPDGTETLQGIYYVSPSGATYANVKVTATTAVATTSEHGVLTHGSVSLGNYTGYYFSIDPTGGTNATAYIKYLVSGTPTTLASRAVTNAHTNAELEVTHYGCDASFRWRFNGGAWSDPLTATHCGQASGFAGLGTVDTACLFTDFNVEDLTPDLVELDASFSKTAASATVPEKAQPSYGRCEGDNEDECDGITHCGCTSWVLVHAFTTSASISGEIEVGANPTWCGGDRPAAVTAVCDEEPCAGGAPTCDPCPAPYPPVTLCLTGCRPDALDVDDEPNMCGGFSAWVYSVLACP